MQQVLSGPSLARGEARASAEPEQLQLFESAGISLEALRMERAAIAGRKRSGATRRAYRADWADFAAWCGAAGRGCLPASADTAGLYLVDLARRGRLPSTIARRASAIGGAHLAAGHASPITPDVRELLAGLRRKLGAAPRHAKAAVSVEALQAMLQAAQPDLVGVRDRAIILLGFASGLRRSELAALQLSDVTVQREGVVLHVARSKTDQEGAGRVLGVHRGKRAATDPVRVLDAWIVERGRWAGPLFCAVVRRRKDRGVTVERVALSGEAIGRVVKEAARRAGLDPAQYAGHSLRAGCATAGAANGAPELAIMARTGHKSLGMLGRYVRHGSVFAVDPLAGVL
jgi:integrase